MTVKKIFTLLLLMIPLLLWSQDPDHPVKYNTFKPGERLVYSLKYGPLQGGEALLKVDETYLDGKYVYHATALGRTVGIVDKLFRVEDIYQSYFDPVTNKPYKAIRDIHEGNYERYNEVIFNYEDTVVHSQRSGEIKVPHNILDIVSTFYYLRRIDFSYLNPGDVISVDTYFADELFPFDIRYKGIEYVNSPLGRIRCKRFDPVVEPGRIFEDEDDMTVWLSDDKNYVPILIRFNMIVGSVKVMLEKTENLKHPLQVQHND
ncbi:MAG: DUF3108 domain-containing protein [Bacteroidota bacterium]